MNLSPEGIKFLQTFEGCRLASYPDGTNADGSVKWSIGYGHNGRGVGPNMTITQRKADAFFLDDIAWAEAAVNKVKVDLEQHEFDALVSLVYNIGEPKFKTSTVLKKLNKDDRQGAADAFLLFNKFEGKVNDGLVKRRAEERSRFLNEGENA